MNTKEFSKRITELLKKKKIMKKDFCNDLELTVQSFSLWETKNTVPSAETVLKISEYLDVSCDYLLTGKENGLQPKEPRFTKKQIMDALETALEDFKKSVDKKL